MKRVNKKGFTLIEMLGAVAILGIIATIGIVSVSKVIASAHKKFDNTQYDSFMQAAETYFSDNKSRLPLTPMEWKEISLQELINKKYIEKLLDSNKQEFDYARSKVVVTRLTSGKYQYEAILYRKKGDPIGKISNKVTNQNSNITFKLRDKNKYHKENKTYYARDYPVIDIGIGDTDQLSGYQYIIYRNGKQFKKSENIEISGGLSVNEAVTLGKEFPFGKYSIKVVAYDKSGNKTTNSTDNSGLGDDAFSIYIDRIKPNCAIQIAGTIGDNGWYKEKDISLTLKESDKESGILKHDMQTSKSFSSLGTLTSLTKLVKKQSDTGSTTWYAHVEDKAGNVCETEVNVKVDTKKPSCSIVLSTGGSPNTSKWYNKYTRGEVEPLRLNKGDQGPSGINRYILAMNDSQLPKTYKRYPSNNDTLNAEEGQNDYNGYVRDYAGNDVTCNTHINKDTIDPECPTTSYINYTPLPDRLEYFNCCEWINGTYSCNLCTKPIPMSPNVTFIWSSFSYDTTHSTAYILEHDSGISFTNNYYNNSYASYQIDGKERFKGYYSSRIVVYDQAENDKDCEGPTSEPANIRDDYNCEYANGSWYNESGVEVSYDVYKKACLGEYYCEYVDGDYYDNDGNVVDYDGYDASCNSHTCEKVGNTYYDRNGDVVSESEYEDSCREKHICEKVGSTYYDADGNTVNEAKYKESCLDEDKRSCVHEGNDYYDKDGDKVTEAQYMTSCNIKSDLKCPKITSSGGTAGKWTDSTVTLSFSNFGSGVKHYKWYTSKDGGKNWSGSGALNDPKTATSKTLEAEGSNRMGKLVLIGADGSEQECLTSTYKIDKTAPKCGSATIKTNNGSSSKMCRGDKWHKSVSRVRVEWDCSDQGDVKSTIDNKSSQCEKAIDISSNFEGEKTITKEIKDKAGNSKTCEKTVYIDNKAPTIGNCTKNASGWKQTSCYQDYRGTPSTVLRPLIEDGGSGYVGAYYKWASGDNQVTRDNTRSHHECMASASNMNSFQYRNLCDCVGNCRNPNSLTTVHCS